MNDIDFSVSSLLPINVNRQNDHLGFYRASLFQIFEEKQYFDTLKRDKLLPDLEGGSHFYNWLYIERLLVRCLVVKKKLDFLQPGKKWLELSSGRPDEHKSEREENKREQKEFLHSYLHGCIALDINDTFEKIFVRAIRKKL